MLTLTLKQAKQDAGTLGHPSKMPGLSYGLPASACKAGSRLAKVCDSVCSECYALNGNYQYPSVTISQNTRLNAMRKDLASWKRAMIRQISHYAQEPYFRWHDSGDIQSANHLHAIFDIAIALPHIRFWLPTKETAIVRRVLKTRDCPDNLAIRISARMIDGKAPKAPNTSTVHRDAKAQGYACPAPTTGGECGKCRACWSKDVPNVSYHFHR